MSQLEPTGPGFCYPHGDEPQPRRRRCDLTDDEDEQWAEDEERREAEARAFAARMQLAAKSRQPIYFPPEPKS